MTNSTRRFGRQRTAARLLCALVLTWAFALASPCMAAPVSGGHPCPAAEGSLPELVDICGLAALDCQLPNTSIPLAVPPDAPDRGAVPVAMLPPAGRIAVARLRPAPADHVAHPLRPPLYLEFASLLI